MVGAGFERDVGRGARSAAAGGTQRHHFGVGLAGTFMPAFAEHAAAVGDDAADHRIGVGGETAAFGQLQRAGHVGVVVGGKGAHPGTMSIRCTGWPRSVAAPWSRQPRRA